MDLGNFASLSHFIPELILVAGILAIVIIDLIVRDKMRLGALCIDHRRRIADGYWT